MEKIMKNQIKISLAVLSALAVSADAQAMFKARLAQPQTPKMAQHSRFEKAQENRMEMSTAKRLNKQFLKNSFAHRDLLAERNEVIQKINHNRNTLIGTWPLFVCMYDVAWTSFPTLALATLGAGLFKQSIASENQHLMQRQKALEDEIVKLAKGRKKEIVLAEDIQ